jgi:hypothetical protein
MMTWGSSFRSSSGQEVGTTTTRPGICDTPLQLEAMDFFLPKLPSLSPPVDFQLSRLSIERDDVCYADTIRLVSTLAHMPVSLQLDSLQQFIRHKASIFAFYLLSARIHSVLLSVSLVCSLLPSSAPIACPITAAWLVRTVCG